MKLRLRGDSLRLRLTRSEVDAIGAASSISETLHLPDGSELAYTLEVANADSLIMRRENNSIEIVVQIAKSMAHEWASSDQVGYSGETPLQIGAVSVLIEKDFTCITPRTGEEELDTFPNPQAAG